jgi:hypothetical protein
VTREATGPRDFTRANSEVYELNRHGKLNEAVLANFAKNHQYEEMTATIALFCGAKSEVIESLMKYVNSEGLIIVCKAAKISWSTVQLILQARFSHHILSQQELDEARDAFFELSQEAAQRTVRFMLVQEAAKKAG